MLEFPCPTWLAAAELFFALVIGHALADFPLQGEFLAICKNRRFLVRLKDPNRPPELWPYCMGAHCLIHAGAVWIVTGSVVLGVVELVLHWTLDVLKCSGLTHFGWDQIAHVLCKAAYVAVGLWLGMQAA
ncbi:MAG: DUF3307 domain-containing protein [Verrucomicrobiales bacterium]|nr:DUF3307 domain-containing protein [Verrucomicrobiales bacterium]